jgi:hypothetical protein
MQEVLRQNPELLHFFAPSMSDAELNEFLGGDNDENDKEEDDNGGGNKHEDDKDEKGE